MKNRLLLLILITISIASSSVPAISDDDLQRREQLAREEVLKSPSSERAHTKLAGILIEQKRYKEARAELSLIQKLNPENPVIRTMLKAIEIEESNLTPKEKLDEAMKNLSESMKPLDSVISLPSKEVYDKEKKELDALYGISTYQYPKETRPVFSQTKRLILDLRSAGKKEEALKLSQKEVDLYPESVQAKIDHIQLLLDCSMLDNAQALVEEGLAMSPGHPFLRILQDGINKILKSPSMELREQLINKLRLQLTRANLIRTESIVKMHNLGGGKMIEQKELR